jgi:DNA-directed RNA polymerase beta' subunit
MYNDIIFDRVISIDFVKPTTDYVYDFTIEKTRTFMTYNGLVNEDTFHAAGISVKTVVVGVPRFSELLSATKFPKMVNCLIYLNESFDSITHLRERVGSIFTEITLRRIVKGYELIKNKPLEMWHDLFCYLYQIDMNDLHPELWRVRFYLDIDVMYEYKITMKMIASSIKKCDKYCYVMYTPDSEGILDVFMYRDIFEEVDKNKEKKQEEEEEEEDIEVEPENIEHIENIENIENDEDINDEDINDEEEEEEEKTEIRQKIQVSQTFQDDNREEPIPSDIYRLMHMEDKVIPEFLNLIISGVEKVRDIFFEKRKDEWIIATEGSNLYGLFCHPIVNKTRTICNNMWEIYNVFGIEATRQFLIEEYMDVVSSDGSFVNSSHVELLVDVMVYTGTIIAISRYGQKKVGCGPMAKASFEESVDNFLKAGVNGEREATIGVSASIMLGKMPKTGTGVFDLMLDMKKIHQTALSKSETKAIVSEEVVEMKEIKEKIPEIPKAPKAVSSFFKKNDAKKKESMSTFTKKNNLFDE